MLAQILVVQSANAWTHTANVCLQILSRGFRIDRFCPPTSALNHNCTFGDWADCWGATVSLNITQSSMWIQQSPDSWCKSAPWPVSRHGYEVKECRLLFKAFCLPCCDGRQEEEVYCIGRHADTPVVKNKLPLLFSEQIWIDKRGVVYILSTIKLDWSGFICVSLLLCLWVVV